MSRQFLHRVRVPYAHTDQMGFVYYAHYFVYFEMARAELLREVGLPYTAMEARGIRLPVVEAHCAYLQPARFDDDLEVRTTCAPFQGARLRLEYELRREGETIATGYTQHVCMTPAGKVLRPTQELLALAADSAPAAGPARSPAAPAREG